MNTYHLGNLLKCCLRFPRPQVGEKSAFLRSSREEVGLLLAVDHTRLLKVWIKSLFFEYTLQLQGTVEEAGVDCNKLPNFTEFQRRPKSRV